MSKILSCKVTCGDDTQVVGCCTMVCCFVYCKHGVDPRLKNTLLAITISAMAYKCYLTMVSQLSSVVAIVHFTTAKQHHDVCCVQVRLGLS